MSMKKKIISIIALIVAMSSSAAFQCNIKVPAGSVGVSRTATITYSNDGSSAIAAPYVRVEAGDKAPYWTFHTFATTVVTFHNFPIVGRIFDKVW